MDKLKDSNRAKYWRISNSSKAGTGAHSPIHTPNIAFRHRPPNSATIEGAFFISAQLSTDAVSVLRKVVVVDRFYIALFSALEQTHCARM